MFETTPKDELRRLAKEIEKIGKELDSALFFSKERPSLDVPIARLAGALVELQIFRDMNT